MNDKEESLISHLEALRTTLMKSLIFIGCVLPFTLYFSPKFMDLLIKIIVGNNNITLNYFSPTEVFLLQIKTAAMLDLIISFPYIAKQFWNFLVPALYENEKRFIRTVVIISSVLFSSGAAFCIFLILPFIIRFGISFSSDSINAMFGISNIINLTLWLSTAFGIMFQFPVAAYMLVKFDIMSYETLKNARPYVVILILILAGLLTPPDIVSQVMLFAPTYALFELGLLFSRKLKRKEAS